MTNLYILMLMYLAYAAISLWLFNYNLLSPSVVFSSSLAGMLCLAYYAANYMDMLFAINFRTFSIFAFAGFVFIAAEFLVYAGHTVNMSRKNSLDFPAKPEPLFIHRQIQGLTVVLMSVSCVIALIVLYLNTGGGSFSERIKVYKEILLYHHEDLKLHFITAQLYKINIIIADLFGYVLVYNMTVCNIPARKLIGYIASVVLYIVFSVIYTGARQSAVEIILFLMMIYVVLNMKPGEKKKIYLFIIKIIPILLLIASIFTVAGTFVGRAKTYKSNFQNLTEYICGGLYSFNIHIDEGASTKIFGQFSLSFVYAVFQNMGLMSREYAMRTGDFDMYGNTVSVFGRWYRDFDAIGVFIITGIVSMLYSLFFYKKIIYSANRNKEHHLARIFYCQFMTSLIWAGYDDRISALLTVQSIVFIMLTTILYKILITDKFKLI